MTTKPSNPENPKDKVGVSKWRQFVTVPARVMWEVGVAMLEGALKYGRYNYRPAGVRASIYIDAAKGHIDQWWEGEDLDPDTGLSHITKAIASLIVLRDGMIEGNFQDDRPPKHDRIDFHRAWLQEKVEEMFDRYDNPPAPFVDPRAAFEPMMHGWRDEVEEQYEHWEDLAEDPNPPIDVDKAQLQAWGGKAPGPVKYTEHETLEVDVDELLKP